MVTDMNNLYLSCLASSWSQMQAELKAESYSKGCLYKEKMTYRIPIKETGHGTALSVTESLTEWVRKNPSMKNYKTRSLNKNPAMENDKGTKQTNQSQWQNVKNKETEVKGLINTKGLNKNSKTILTEGNKH